MLFNELIDKQGIEGVTSKTNISTVNLTYLVNEDFEKLNRVKALGFLLILEREYKDIEVAELREKIKAYYEEHKPEDDNVVMVATSSTTGGGNFSFFKWFVILALLGGGYYLYTQGQLDGLIQKFEDKQDFFDDNKALENNSSDEDAQKVVVGKSETESVTIETPIAPKVTRVELDNNTSNDGHNSQHKEDTKVIEAIQSVLAVENNLTVKAIVQEVSEDFLASEANKSVEVVNEPVEVEVASTITTISINPTRGMLWYGFINLDTKKRREFMKKVSTPFEINGGKWLLVTGHGYVDVASDEKTLEIADNKKHYFYIDSHELKEIDKKEFRDLNGRRGW